METARPIESEPRADEATRQPSQPPARRPATATPPLKKHPFLAAFLAGFPGIGHVYNGLYVRGVIFFGIVASLLAMAGAEEDGNHPVLAFTVAFVWIFNVIDAARQAQLINHGYAQDLGLTDAPRVPKASQGGLLTGLLLLVIGIVASLQLYFDVDLTWMLRYWPLGLMGIGAWLIVAWFREKRKREEPAEESKLF